MTGPGLSIDRNGRLVTGGDSKSQQTQTTALSPEWASAIEQAAKAKGMSVDQLDQSYYFVAVQPGGSVNAIGQMAGLDQQAIANSVYAENQHLIRPGHGLNLVYGDQDPAGQQDVVLLPKAAFSPAEGVQPPQEFAATLTGDPAKDVLAVTSYMAKVPANQQESTLITLVGLDYGPNSDAIRQSLVQGYLDNGSDWGTSSDANKRDDVKLLADNLLKHTWGDDKTDVAIDTMIARLAKDRYGADVDMTAWNGRVGPDPDGTP